MPLYFPCPCRNSKSAVAQLTRIHVVTPKAPVNIILDPKVKPELICLLFIFVWKITILICLQIRTGGKNSHTFLLGLPEPPKLTQSAYWILRLPYIYEGDDGVILPPSQLTASTSLLHGCLLAGMFGITEMKSR